MRSPAKRHSFSAADTAHGAFRLDKSGLSYLMSRLLIPDDPLQFSGKFIVAGVIAK